MKFIDPESNEQLKKIITDAINARAPDYLKLKHCAKHQPENIEEIFEKNKLLFELLHYQL